MSLGTPVGAEENFASNKLVIFPLFCGKITKFFAAGCRPGGMTIVSFLNNFLPPGPPIFSDGCTQVYMVFLGWLVWLYVLYPFRPSIAASLFSKKTTRPYPVRGTSQGGIAADFTPSPTNASLSTSHHLPLSFLTAARRSVWCF